MRCLLAVTVIGLVFVAPALALVMPLGGHGMKMNVLDLPKFGGAPRRL